MRPISERRAALRRSTARSFQSSTRRSSCLTGTLPSKRRSLRCGPSSIRRTSSTRTISMPVLRMRSISWSLRQSCAASPQRKAVCGDCVSSLSRGGTLISRWRRREQSAPRCSWVCCLRRRTAPRSAALCVTQRRRASFLRSPRTRSSAMSVSCA